MRGSLLVSLPVCLSVCPSLSLSLGFRYKQRLCSKSNQSQTKPSHGHLGDGQQYHHLALLSIKRLSVHFHNQGIRIYINGSLAACFQAILSPAIPSYPPTALARELVCAEEHRTAIRVGPLYGLALSGWKSIDSVWVAPSHSVRGGGSVEYFGDLSYPGRADQSLAGFRTRHTCTHVSLPELSSSRLLARVFNVHVLKSDVHICIHVRVCVCVGCACLYITYQPTFSSYIICVDL